MPFSAISGADQGGTCASIPPVYTRTAVAGGTITAGQAVGFYTSGLTAATFDTDTVYAIGAATQYVAGVALHAATTGQRLRIQCYGPNLVAMTNASTSTATHVMVPAAAGAFTSTAQSHANDVPTIFGFVMVASGTTAQPANTVFINCRHGSNMVTNAVDKGGRTAADVTAGRLTGGSICTRRVKAGEAITAGQAVSHYTSGLTATTFSGDTVYVGGATPCWIAGVALESAQTGGWLTIQNFGPNLVAMTNAATSTATHCMVPAATGTFTSTVSSHDNSTLAQFGYVVVASGSTAQPAGTVFITCPREYGSYAAADQGGTGSDYPEYGVALVQAGEAITKGDCLSHYTSGVTAGTFDGQKVFRATDTTDPICGVALSAATSGSWFRMQTSGPNLVAMTVGTSDSNPTEAMCAHATNGAFTSVPTDSTTVSAITKFGHVIVASSSSTQAINTVYLDCRRF